MRSVYIHKFHDIVQAFLGSRLLGHKRSMTGDPVDIIHFEIERGAVKFQLEIEYKLSGGLVTWNAMELYRIMRTGVHNCSAADQGRLEASVIVNSEGQAIRNPTGQHCSLDIAQKAVVIDRFEQLRSAMSSYFANPYHLPAQVLESAYPMFDTLIEILRQSNRQENAAEIPLSETFHVRASMGPTQEQEALQEMLRNIQSRHTPQRRG